MTEILQFSGRESPEDAAVWLNRLIASTGSFSDSGVLRFLGSRLEADSPARRWFDALDAGIKVSWPLFERKFQERWITNPRSQPSELDVRDLFQAHTLPQELLTGDLLSDPASYQAKLFVWAEDHLHMGKRTSYRDPDLIQTTERLLPGFIQAHLHTYGDPNSSFDAYCRRLKTIPEETLEFERIRLERSSGDWRSVMESKIDQISNMVQRLITFMGADNMYQGLPSSVANNEVTDNADTTSLLANEPSNASVLLEVNNSRTDSDNLEINFNVPSELRESSQQARSSRSNVKEISRALGWRKPECLVDSDTLKALIHDINLTDLIRSTYAKVTSETLPTGDHLMSDEDSTSGRLLWAVIGMQKRNLLGADAHALVNNCTRAWEQYNNASGKLTDVVSPTQKSVSTKGRKPETTTLHLQPSGKPTAAGGIFKRNATLDQPYVDPQLSVWYMVLSAYLAEFNTGDRRYRDAAIQSVHYILDHMLDPATGLIKDVYINAVTGQQVDGATLSCHLTGWVIQGLSVLAHVTYWEDQSWGTKAIEIAMAAMFYGEWHSPDGILTVGTDEDPLKDSDVKRYKGILNYGLLVAYKRNPSNKPFRDLVRSYINVQFNALYELARHGNYYAIDWRGPNIERKFHSQLAALTTMVSALTVNIDDEGDDQIDYNRDPW